jgi:LacI family transcriptional regulator
MPSQPTIKDVARLSGVSIGTVDRVLHSRGKVSKKNEQAVLSAIEALNYQPSQIAQALVNRKSNLKIGVCLPQVEREFWAEAAAGMEAVRRKLSFFGVELVVEYTYNYSFLELKKAVDRLISTPVDCLLLVPSREKQAELDREIPLGIPYATVIEDVPDSRRIFHVGPDDLAMGHLAGRLVSLYTGPGVRCVILAANQQFYGTQQRIAGFRDVLMESDPAAQILEICDIPIDTEKIAYESIYEIAQRQMQLHPELNTFYVTNGLTQWAAAAVNSSPARGRIRVFGYECTEMTQKYIREGIIGATIYQRPAQQWYNAIYLMYEYMSGVRTITDPIVRAECDIILKESIPLIHIGEISNL